MVILLEGLSSVFGQLVVPDRFVVTSDSAATAANVLNNEALFRAGVLMALTAVALHVVWVVLFYELLAPVSRTVALLAASVGLVAVGLQAVSAVVQGAPLVILQDGELSATGGVQELAYLAFLLRAEVFNTYLVFFGLWCLLTGYLIARSGFIPRLVGLLQMLAGVAYLVLLWPPLADALAPYYLVLGVGEVVLLLWLLVKGVDSERWYERAARTSSSMNPG